MFDLNTLALKDTLVLELLHPVTDEPLTVKAADGSESPVTVTLWGTSSKQYRTAINAMQNRAMKRDQTKKKATPEELRKEGIELLTACSQTSANLALDGTPVTDEDTFRKLYGDARFTWLKDQVDTALANVSNFITA
jgi:hypothetical protein